MRNMSSTLTNHNKKILAENVKQYECNCRNKDEHPQIIYEANVTTLNTFKNFTLGYLILFLQCYNNHKRDFRNRCYEKSTELSKYTWSLQESGIEFTIHLKILSQVKRMTKHGYCSLCLKLKSCGCSTILTICTYLIRI